MSATRLAHFALLPELELLKTHSAGPGTLYLVVRKTSQFEVCPRCASRCHTIYDRRRVKVFDAPLRNKKVLLEISKRRFLCKSCSKVFMEPVAGISKGSRFTQRMKAHILWCCEKFSDLKAVKIHTGCSFGYIYKALYEQLELNRRKKLYPWPRVIGLDEHSFKRNKIYGYTEFVTMIVDHKNCRAIEVVDGKSVVDLKTQTSHFSGRENVNWVTMDLCPPFRNFVKDNFRNARIVADKFHVVRLLDNHINRYRKEITGDQRKNPIRKLLLKNSASIDFWKRGVIHKWLQFHPVLREIYEFKQGLHSFYRIKGYNRAKTAFRKMVDRMGYSKIMEVQTLRKTLIKWQAEILNYFCTGLTNARVEGFNNKAKLIKRKAYGYKSFRNYRLRVLNACC